MNAFTFSNSPYPIRDDLIAAYRDFWHQLATAGTWWSGEERIAIAAEARQATQCAFCAERKNALSAYHLPGEHTAAVDSPLSEWAVDAVHRVVTDQTRITKDYIQKNAATGLSEGKYVELVGVVVCVFGIDEFCRALGFALESLPAPVAGEPTEYQPGGLESDTGMVSMISAGQRGPAEHDLWPEGHDANVVRALSQVPNAVREWEPLSDAQYLPGPKIDDPAADTERALNRMQIELVAGRVSSHNECFY
jgi:hypothetical protein